MNGRRSLRVVAGFGMLGTALVRLLRALPLVQEEPIEEGPRTWKGQKKDFKKKGRGPRTRRKKAKKGK